MIIWLLVASIGYEYLLVDPVAHRVGMGYALAADGYSVHYNPAGLCIASQTYYSSAYLNYIGGTHFGYVGYEKNQIGLGIKYFYSGKMKKTDALGNEYGTFSTNFIDFNIGKGFFYNDIGLGMSLKFVYENIDSLFALGAGADIGAIYFLIDYNAQIGMAIKNIGTSIKPFIDEKENLPYEINLGIARTFNEGWVGFDIVKPAIGTVGLRVGGEYAITEIFSIKASFNTMFSSMRTGNGSDILAGIMAGFGIKKSPIYINYSYAPYFDLGNGHRVSISIGG